ncbi:MAG: IS5 family transposase [Candidatus Bathyarchaeota archaeon]
MVSAEPTDSRRERGYFMAKTFRITKDENGSWIVPSASGNGKYTVTLRNDRPSCTCLGFGVHHLRCKHIYALEAFLKDEIENPPKTTKKTYARDWPSINQAQTKEKELFQKLLFDICSDVSSKQYTFGRPALPMADMIFASALKVYSTFSLRRFISDMKEAKEKGYCEKVCSYSTVSNYMRNKDITSILVELIQKSSMPLKSVETDFAVDSSGFGTSKFDRWYSFRYGKEINRHSWIKAHLINGVKTHIITSIKITQRDGGDSPQFGELVSDTAQNFQVSEVSADKAYSSKGNMNLVSELGGTPYIPFKSNAIGKSRGNGSRLWNKMFYYFLYKHDEFNEHYHKRSNVETVFHMLKSKFGDSVRSREWTSQVNEVLLKVLCHNICVLIQEMFELGIEPNFN